VRVLHVIDSLGGSGGAEHGLVREVTRFSAATEQRVVRLFPKSQLDASLTSSGIEVLPLGFRAEHAGWNWPAAARKVSRLVHSYNPDVIHSSLFTANLVSQLAGKMTGVPVVSTFTLSGDPRLLTQYQPGAGSWRGHSLRWLASRAAAMPSLTFRALTEDALQTNCELLGVKPSRARVIPRGIEVDLRPHPLRSRRELGLPDDGPLIVNVGRQTAQKGHLSLLEAFDIVRREIDCHLAIVGREGDASRSLRLAITEHGLSDSVTLVGYTPDVYHYVANANVFVFPSFMEGLGTAVLEAMALEVPVVAYDIPPINEITDGGRLASLVEPGDESALAERIFAALESGRERVEQARQWTLSNYSIDTVAPRVEALLTEVAAG
jgi:glycosyltransferase involved in cell wall biosynthesis